jgi:hypothetical protein
MGLVLLGHSLPCASQTIWIIRTIYVWGGGSGAIGTIQDIETVGNHAYVAASSYGLSILDVQDPAAPVRIGGVRTLDWANGVAVSGNYAFVADQTAGLTVVNIQNPTNPVISGGIRATNTSSAEGIVVSGNYAYVADLGSGLQVFDISNPVAPILVGTCNTTDAGYSRSYDLEVSGGYAYIADLENGLRVLDVSNPTAPTRAGAFPTPPLGRALKVRVSGNLAYVGCEDGVLRVVDVSNPTAPVLHSSLNLGGQCYGMSFRSNILYVANHVNDYTNNLKLVDVSNPSMLAEVGSLATSNAIFAVAAIGDYQLVGGWLPLTVLQVFPLPGLLIDRPVGAGQWLTLRF